MARTPEEFRTKQQIDVRVLHEVVGIDPKAGRVRVVDLSANREWWEPYDHLLIATGAVPLRPKVPGADAAGIYGVHTLESGIRLRKILDESRPARAVIVGGGYIGLEMAEAFLLRGMQVSLVEKAPQVMGTLDEDMAVHIAQALTDRGVTLHLNEGLEAFEVRDGRVRAVITSQRSLETDIVLLGMGVVPNTDLAREAHIPLGERGAVRVDRRMATQVEGVWAAGDCAESFHRLTGRPIHVALGTVANRHGRVAGMNMAGGEASFSGVLGTAVTRICSLEIARTGLQTRELEALGRSFVSRTIESHTRAGYFPGSGRIHVKLLADSDTGAVLGAQIVGEEGAAKRIDVMAAAITAGLTAQEVSELDLGYAPPFSPLWDPLIIAARLLAKDAP
ncbi:Pyruvate/2-oxoglutarate dehydrogenase complex, dihydrolipoamide dehydrogenase (E3) component [Desulfacinum infernum DSM 9756]|uniref:Pyruvate/2-oxoglutarate dehydrogenase complex, dihydrolipoamide dehydrogenase (E3) component n=1 Tax=Desulfacinum infernum DSM 9756 TaxID=1121391 RepID=A0A1M5B1C8_9BACT|nr:FAD-dependent oxidoreductase [Desulfacinum infernum]SHF36288.1 Pyruvate/2-oxoglutarate dehydrogenase complex, dihydrolipoamide dehydrogenase (E3) component [Desulfacinum infernum DSM 9756]